jgi:hypothetical protein
MRSLILDEVLPMRVRDDGRTAVKSHLRTTAQHSSGGRPSGARLSVDFNQINQI